MTRKDYVKFAAMIRANTWLPAGNSAAVAKNEAVEQIKRDIADIFAADNPRFDRERFYRACEPESEA